MDFKFYDLLEQILDKQPSTSSTAANDSIEISEDSNSESLTETGKRIIKKSLHQLHAVISRAPLLFLTHRLTPELWTYVVLKCCASTKEVLKTSKAFPEENVCVCVRAGHEHADSLEFRVVLRLKWKSQTAQSLKLYWST